MNKLNAFISKYFNIIVIVMLVILFFRSCDGDSRILSRKVDKLSDKVDSLKAETVTKKDLQIEGLKAEKRMIQSTDRKMLDVNRQSEIDKELESLSK